MDEEKRVTRACQEALSKWPRPDMEVPSSSSSDSHFFSLPPFEAFAYDISSERAEIQFENCVEVGDLLYVQVASVDAGGARVYPICFASRLRRDLSLTKLSYAVPVSLLQKRLQISSYYKAKVISRKPISLIIEEASALDESQLPLYYRNSTKLSKKMSFEDYLHDNPRIMRDTFLENTLYMPKRSSFSFLHIINDKDFTHTAAKMRKHQDEKEARYFLIEGAKKIKEGDYDQAIKEFNEALKICPKMVDIMISRGTAYYHKKFYEIAIKDFEQGLQLDPAHKNGKGYLMTTLITWGQELTAKDDYQSAREKFKRVLELNPGDADALKGLAKIKKKEDEIQIVKTVSFEERRRLDKKRKQKEAEERAKKRAKAEENRKKLDEMEKFIASLKSSK